VSAPPGSQTRPGLAAGLFIAGISALALNLRAAVTSLPPVFPELGSGLHLSSGTLALLAATPVLCFGAFSPAAAPLSRRFGEERVLGGALVLLAAGLLLRGALPGALLFPGTILAGAAIALLNVLLPSLVKRRRPAQAGLLIGVYLLLLSVGAVVASLVAVPVFNAAGGGHGAIQLTLALWALPALIAAAVWLPQFRYRTQPAAAAPAGAGSHHGRSQHRGTGLAGLTRSALAWQVTAFMGLQSLSYYAALSWFPTLLRDRGVSAAHAGDLSALMNVGNGITALLVPALAHRLADQRSLAVGSVVVSVAGLTGAAFAPVSTAAPWMLVLGMGQGATLGLAIFFTVARSPDPVTASSLSALSQGGGYLISAAGPLLLGFLHSVTGGWTIPVLTLLAVAAGQLVSGVLAGRALTVPATGPPSGPAGRLATDQS
jgi:CP family cyanate transporter-like MFS transporter